MSAQPDVTVIVPVYNTMPYLVECLDSLVAQSLPPGGLQVVAVDDGSTDGSGEVLDRYAADHPGLFTVLHQPNSGGPARPCNKGLEIATGRYVFFLGSDDYLDPEAAERMVAAADEWGSDVLCCRLIGVGGRWVSQKLFANTAEEVPFPSELLASGLSNTKLFRRSLVAQHHLRFPETLRVGSDQPFTIEAMLRASRVSVLADRPYYYAVKRESADNITYTSTWRARLADLGAVVRRVAELIQPGDGRDAILQRHFNGEVATLLRRDLGELHDVDARALIEGVNELADAFLTDGVRARLRPINRRRFALAQAGGIEHLRSLCRAEDGDHVVLVTGSTVRRVPKPDAQHAEDADYLQPQERWMPSLRRAFEAPAEVHFEGSGLVVSLPTELTPSSATYVTASLVNASGRSSWGPRVQDRPPTGQPRTVPAEVVSGRLNFRMDLAEVPRVRPGIITALRIDVATSRGFYRLPVFATVPISTTFNRTGTRLLADLQLDEKGRVFVEIDRSNT